MCKTENQDYMYERLVHSSEHLSLVTQVIVNALNEISQIYFKIQTYLHGMHTNCAMSVKIKVDLFETNNSETASSIFSRKYGPFLIISRDKISDVPTETMAIQSQQSNHYIFMASHLRTRIFYKYKHHNVFS